MTEAAIEAVLTDASREAARAARLRYVSDDEPGYARIACTLRVTPLLPGACEVQYEARTHATDPASRRAFRRYWLLVSPFVGIVMRSLLAEVDRLVTTRR